jgi:hypothetical protein
MKLWRPFTALGLAGGWIAWGIHEVGWMHLPLPSDVPRFFPLGAVLLGVIPVAMLWLGVFVESRARERWLFPLVLWTLLGGALAGSFVSLVAAGPVGLTTGWFAGALYALAFSPAIIAVVHAAKMVRARPDTPPGRAERRGPWLGVALSVAVAAPLALNAVPFLGTVPLALAGLASGVAALVLVNDLSELIPHGRLCASLAGTQLRGSMPLADAGARFYDLGVGDTHFDEIATGEPYRSADRVVRTIHGDPKASLRALTNAIARDVAVLLACAGIFASLASY